MTTPQPLSYVPPSIVPQHDAAPPTVKRKKKTRKNRPDNPTDTLLSDSTQANYDAFQQQLEPTSPVATSQPMSFMSDAYSSTADAQRYPAYPDYGLPPTQVNESSESVDDYSIRVTHEADLTQLQQQSVSTFNKKLQISTYLLMIPVVMILFTPLWWSSLPFITAIACLIVYAYSHPTHLTKAVFYYFICLSAYEVAQFVLIVVFFVGLDTWSTYEQVVIVGLLLNFTVVTPFALYYCYWLYKSLTLTIMSF